MGYEGVEAAVDKIKGKSVLANVDTGVTEDSVILEIAQKGDITSAEVCIRRAVTRGQVPIPFSVKRHQYESSRRAVRREHLTGDEIRANAGLEKDCRLIKGQVFLWEGAQEGHDLWDESGTIVS